VHLNIGSWRPYKILFSREVSTLKVYEDFNGNPAGPQILLIVIIIFFCADPRELSQRIMCIRIGGFGLEVLGMTSDDVRTVCSEDDGDYEIYGDCNVQHLRTSMRGRSILVQRD
jgi:hypothetical protein